MNTPVMTMGHVETMEELRDAVHRYVAAERVVSIEAGPLLRLLYRAADEATMLDYSMRLLACSIKKNGVLGQRHAQLYREMEAFRAAMIARGNGEAA